MAYSLVFFIFLLEFHALVLSITGPPYLDLNGMVKDTVHDGPGGYRITQVLSPGLFFDVCCKDQRTVEMVSFIHYLEQQMSFFGDLEFQPVMTHFINDEQIGVDILAKPFQQVFFKHPVVQITDQGSTSCIQYFVSLFTGD